MASRFDSGWGTMKSKLPPEEQWRDRAACAGLSRENYDLFFPPGAGNGHAYAAAQEVCAECPVAAECLAYSLANELHFGIWGGTTPNGRGHRVGGWHGQSRSEMQSGIVGVTPREQWLAPGAEFDLWDLTFTREELRETVEARRHRREVLDRVDAELAQLEATA